MITTFYPPYSFGGDGIFVYRLSNALAQRGHLVDVVHCLNSYHVFERSTPEAYFDHHPNVTVHRLNSKAGFLSPLATQQTGLSNFKRGFIEELIEQKQFDVINYHNMSLIGLDVLSFGTAVKLYTTHEHWLVCPMHNLWKYGKATCKKKSCISCQLAGFRPVQWWRYSGLMGNAIRHIDRFIAPSESIIEKHNEFGFEGPFVHIPHFVPREEEHPLPEEARPRKWEKPYFLYAGRLEKIKGIESLIPVFQQYRNGDLLIAGSGALENKLKQEARHAGNIYLLGNLDYAELRKFYHHAVAVLVPSLCFEVFGLVVLEAFSEKTPVLAREIGALKDLIEKSRGGYVFNTDAELIERMQQLQDWPEERQKLGMNGYSFYRNNGTEQQYLNRYFGLIAEVAAEKKMTSLSMKLRQLAFS